MSRRAILQIGTEKTGTTSLQKFLSANRARLAERGFIYPRFCGDINQTGLAAYAMAEERMDPLREAYGIRQPADVPHARRHMEAVADLELSGASTALFCNEHCHSRLTSLEEIAALRRFLARYFDDIQVSIYLRRQDQVAVSLYSTRLKSGGTDREILPRTDAKDPYFNYDRSLGLWEAIFGPENITVRIFDRDELAGGSVVTDFLETWAIGEASDFVQVANENESISPPAQGFLRLVNGHLAPIEGLPLDAVLGPLSAQLARLFPGSGSKPDRAAARAFYAMYAPSNEAVRQRYFPDRPALFREDFSTYPETVAQTGTSLAEIAAIVAQLHRANVVETRRLEAEIAIRDARLSWERGETVKAMTALENARGWLPTYAPVHRALGEFLLQEERIAEAAAAARAATEFGPEVFDYWHFLGVVLRRAGDLDGAEAAQARALQIMPGHAGARASLDQIRTAIDSRATAQRAARSA